VATLEELLSQYGLSEQPSQTKVAQEQAPKNTNEEVNQVLEGLGLFDAEEGVEKVAQETENENKGDRMSLTGIYSELFGDGENEVNDQGYEGNEASELFGELTAHYFSAAQANYLDKIAGEVEHDDEQPMENMKGGKEQDPHMPVNYQASGGAPMHAMTGNTSPYTLKDAAILKAVLKRLGQAQPGAVGAYQED
jgi:hypothetical protein